MSQRTTVHGLGTEREPVPRREPVLDDFDHVGRVAVAVDAERVPREGPLEQDNLSLRHAPEHYHHLEEKRMNKISSAFLQTAQMHGCTDCLDYTRKERRQVGEVVENPDQSP